MELLEFHGLTVTLERKAIRRLYLRVLPPDGRVQISAPLQMPQSEILNFLEQKESWVRRQKEKFSEQPPAPLEYLPGEKIPLWGTEYPLQIVGEILPCGAGGYRKSHHRPGKQHRCTAASRSGRPVPPGAASYDSGFTGGTGISNRRPLQGMARKENAHQVGHLQCAVRPHLAEPISCGVFRGMSGLCHHP